MTWVILGLTAAIAGLGAFTWLAYLAFYDGDFDGDGG